MQGVSSRPSSGIGAPKKPSVPFSLQKQPTNSPRRRREMSSQTRSNSTPKPKPQTPPRQTARNPVKMKLVKRSKDRFKIEQEILEMEAKLKDETEILEQIEALKSKRDNLKSKLNETRRNCSIENENMTEYDVLIKRHEALKATRERLEDDVTKAMAINSILIERMGSSPHGPAYHENSRLRNEKRRILEESMTASLHLVMQRACGMTAMNSSETTEPENMEALIREHEATEAHLRRRMEQLNKIIRERTEQLYNGIRTAALESFIRYDECRSELENLREREKYLKDEHKRLRNATSEDLLDENLLEEAKTQLLSSHRDLRKVQYTTFNERITEMQGQLENNLMKLRQKRLIELNQLKSEQSKIRSEFMKLQAKYNEMLTTSTDIDEPEEMSHLSAEFADLDERIQTILGEEAQQELEIEDRALGDVHICTDDVMKWVSDQHLISLASQARYEALDKQLSVLRDNLGDKAIQAAIASETAEVQHLNSVLVDSSNRLRALDVMLGGEDSENVPLDVRFQSIQERIITILENDEPVAKMNQKEQELRDKLARMKRSSNNRK